jgi:DNA-binding MarR family transcriptional regulator
VELVDRAVQAGLVRRLRDGEDRRIVRLRLTRLGDRRIKQLAELHLAELDRFAPRFRILWEGLEHVGAGR